MKGLRFVVLALVVLVAASMLAQDLETRVPSDIALNYVEGFDQMDAERVARGGALYGNPSEPPFTVHVYTPLQPLIVSLGLRAGIEGFAFARALSMLAVIGTAILVFVSARRRSGWIAFAIAALYLTMPGVGLWSAVGRPDTLAVFFSACGVVLVDRRWKDRAVLLAVPFFLLALLAKQNVAMGLVASCLFLLAKSPTRAVAFGATALVSGLLLLGILEFFSDGWFLFHTVTANAAPYSFAKVVELQRQFASDHWPELVVSLFVLAAWLRERRGTLYVTWFLCSALATLSLGKSGSDSNHLLEFLTAMAFLVANAWPVRTLAERPVASRRLAPVAWVLAGALALFNYGMDERKRRWIEPAEVRTSKVIEKLQGIEGPIISDDATLLYRLNKPLLFRPFAMTQLAYEGNWDDRPIVQLLENREIALVVFEALPGRPPNRARYTAGMRDALTRNYRRVGSYQTQRPFEIYAPRGRPGIDSSFQRPEPLLTEPGAS